jgi:hypothetical protein
MNGNGPAIPITPISDSASPRSCLRVHQTLPLQEKKLMKAIPWIFAAVGIGFAAYVILSQADRNLPMVATM